VQSFGSAAPAAVKDGYLVVAVKGKLAAVDVNSSTAVGVSASDGVVTLTGEARTASERNAYVRAARSVSGVKTVVDKIAIDPHLVGLRQRTRDAALAAKVAAAIAGQAGVNVFHVTPSAHGGVVTLTGTVARASTARTIVATARGVSGVTRVVNRIAIAR
jgi:osmotically-inducible protein OsmY